MKKAKHDKLEDDELNDIESESDTESDTDKLNDNDELDDKAFEGINFKKEIPDDEKWKRPELFDLDQAHLIYGQIYIMTCKTTGKKYVGQVVSHRKNKGRYRFFGIIGRFNGHLCEATTKTRSIGGCTYLNHAIRKYGVDDFTIELLENCKYDDIDERERYHIKTQNTIAPYGYNLVRGGKGTVGWVNPKNMEDFEKTGVNPVLKRGRGFGYVHKKSTLSKMKDRHAEETKEQKTKRKNTMKNTMSTHYKDKRINLLLESGIEFDEKFADHIRPKNKDGKLVGYVIRIKRHKYCEISRKDATLKERYDLLHEALEGAYKIQQEKKKSSVHVNEVIKTNNNSNDKEKLKSVEKVIKKNDDNSDSDDNKKKSKPIKKITKVIKKVTKDEHSDTE